MVFTNPGHCARQRDPTETAHSPRHSTVLSTERVCLLGLHGEVKVMGSVCLYTQLTSLSMKSPSLTKHVIVNDRISCLSKTGD